MNEQDTFKIEQILFDLHLGIKGATKILFLNNRHLKNYIKILEAKGCVNETNTRSIYFKDATRIVIFSKNCDIGITKLTFIASSIAGYDDYIQIGDNEFIRN